MPDVVRPTQAPGQSPWAAGLAHISKVLGATLDGVNLSSRTALFRPLPDDPMAWLRATLPTYLQSPSGDPVPLARHHEEFWDWLWALRPGVAARTFISIWARGGGKSVSVELGMAVVGYFGLRRYALYICDTQKQADDHLASIATIFEILGVERAINRYGFSRGWSATRLRTADGFTADAIGLDAARRGVRIDESRPDLVALDDLDDSLDSPETIQKKEELLTRKILPTGATSLAVVGVQNLPNKDGLFAQLVDGRANFLHDRFVSGPHPALLDLPEQDWYAKETTEDGGTRLYFTGGTPAWPGQDMEACEALLNLMGPRAFEIECQHRIARLEGTVFKREWFQLVDDWPRQAPMVRYWDFAATEDPGRRIARTKDPDWTVGLLLAMHQGQFWVVDIQRVRLSSKGVEDLVRQTAALDGRHVEVWLEEEAGASGKAVTADYRQRVLKGYAVRTWHVTGSKGDRMKAISSAAEAGNVFLMNAPWTAGFIEEVSRFGVSGVHDDQADALSGAHYALTLGSSQIPADLDLSPALFRMTQPRLDRRAQVNAGQAAVVQRWLGLEMEEELL